MFSRGDIIKMIIPLILQNILSVTIGAMDSIMVSAAGEAAVSGVSLVGTLDVLLITAFSSLVTGGSVVISQSLGENDNTMARECAKQLIYVTTGIAVVITVIVGCVREPLLNLLYGKAATDVMQNAQDYFMIISLSFPFLAINSSCAALFRTMGNTVTPMGVSIGMNIINVIGNAVFIYGFHMGAAGAAIATLISRIAGAAVGIVLLHNRKNTVYFDKILRYRPNIGIIKKMLYIGVPHGIEESFFSLGRLMTQSLISSMGTASIAANSVASTIANYQYMTSSAISSVVIPVVGRCIGAKKKTRLSNIQKCLCV